MNRFYSCAESPMLTGFSFPLSVQQIMSWGHGILGSHHSRQWNDWHQVCSFFFSPNPRRRNAKQGWPATPDENLERLTNAGLPYERGIPKCGRCNGKLAKYVLLGRADTDTELGHTVRACPEEKTEVDRVEVKCVNCEAVGHRARDCPEPRKDRFACRNCK